MYDKELETPCASPATSSIGKWKKCARDVDQHGLNAPNAIRKIEEMLDFALERAEKAILQMKTDASTVKYTGTFSSNDKKVRSKREALNERSDKGQSSVVHLNASAVESTIDTTAVKKHPEQAVPNVSSKYKTKSFKKDIDGKESWDTYIHVPPSHLILKPKVVNRFPHIYFDSSKKKCAENYKSTLQIEDAKLADRHIYSSPSDNISRSIGMYGSFNSNSTVSSQEPWKTHINVPASSAALRSGQQVPHIYFDPLNKKCAENCKPTCYGKCRRKDTRVSLSSSSTVSSKRASVSVVSPSESSAVTTPISSNSECNQSDCAKFKHRASTNYQSAISTAPSHLHQKSMTVPRDNNNAQLDNGGVGFSFNFNIVLKDGRGGSHPMHFLGDCQQNRQTGRMDVEEVFVNGKALKVRHLRQESMKESKRAIFLTKLWSILQDESIADIVCWDPSGVSFHVLNLQKFSEEVLCRFFKHKNISSFVRQLNQYGFRKVLAVEQKAMVNDNNVERMQYYHSLFRRGHPELLNEIKRQNTLQPNSRKRNARVAAMKCVTQSSEDNLVSLPQSQLNRISETIDSFRRNYLQVQSKVYDLTRKSELLCNEVRLLREQHLKQQQNMERIVQCLKSQCQLPSVQQYHPGNQTDGESLPLHSFPHNQNLEILSAIEHNIRSETAHYSSISGLSFAPVQKVDNPPEEFGMQKCLRPEIIQSTNSVGFNLDQNSSNFESCSSSALILSSIINHEQVLQELHPSVGHGIDCAIAKEEI
ncbi:HSF-type DNA-binding domain-containing protein [Ditylenchus destructor]|nr:HSF-type DNA-binding domain-containing protein [Ditylenchus destructor]